MKLKGRKIITSAVIAASCGVMIPAISVMADTIGNSNIRLASAEPVAISTQYSESVLAANAGDNHTNNSVFNGLAVAVTDSDVFTTASEDVKAGRLYRNNIASVEGSENGWTKIKSGDLEGYVKNEVLCLNEEAGNFGIMNGNASAEAKADGTKIYKDIENKIEVKAVNADEKLKLVGTRGKMAVVEIDGSDAYVKLSDINYDLGLSTGKTAVAIEKEEAAERAKKAQKVTYTASGSSSSSASYKSTESVETNVNTSNWATGIASAYGGSSDPGCGSWSATGALVDDYSMGVAIPLAWGRRDLLGHTVLISYGGKTVTAVINDLGGMGGGSRSLDLQPGVFKALGFNTCNSWGIRSVSYKIL